MVELTPLYGTNVIWKHSSYKYVHWEKICFLIGTKNHALLTIYSALSSRLFFYNFVKFQNSLSAPMYTVPNSLLLLNVQLPFLTVCIFMLLPPAEVAGKIPHYTVLYRICACHHCTLPSTVYSRSCLSFPFKKMLLVNITTGSDCCL